MKNQIPGQNKESNKANAHDNPEQFPTEKESLLDQYEEEQTVDPIPLEDLNMEQQEEKNKDQTKSNSSTEEKYRADYRETNQD
ncbi:MULTISPECIES: hypothetical protein [Paenibacillus]|uniref:hypothetical protein n=1 Tax=Paenibacillus illinoisensis TaxID=59845 RepID=UPI001C8D33F0|nr:MULTISPECIES: hypothetical protein [Paenibacillus]MBY0218813.1 hypothetical protein [Paenibacillus illinoisensis]WJH29913.1 hypothetical protein N6H13_03985 [Paenibacillus sp. CC-CFT742]